MGKKKDKQKMI
jgi:OTU domain-containing protein 3